MSFFLIVGSAVLQISPAVNAQDRIVDCVHQAIDGPGGYVQGENCAVFSGSEPVRVTDAFLENTRFDQDGLSCALFSGAGFFWVREDGTAISVPTWDNMCAWFAEGLTAANVGGRQVYVDKQLDVVLDPGFDSLSAFDGGYAGVCNGPFVYENRGEPRRTGGRCGLIDRNGELVIELQDADDRSRFTQYGDYRNAHNHCPPPPIEDAESALCHAKRLVARERRHSDDWTEYTVDRLGDMWTVRFLEVGRAAEFTIAVGAERANRVTLIRRAAK